MPKIMIVDDEVIITMQLEERLTSMGYDVAGTASSGETAVEMAKRLKPDLILMDIVMPGKIDGIDASNIIKAELDIPVIFLTAYADDNFVKKAKNAQPFGYIVKPFQEKEIRAAIECALYKKDMERQFRESEEKYRAVVDSAGDAIISADSHGNIISWNNAATHMFGHSADEAFGKPFTLLMQERFHKAYKEGLDRLVSTGKSKIIGKTVEVSALRKNGREFPAELSLAKWKARRGVFFTGIIRDISKRKGAEELLAKEKDRLEGINKMMTGRELRIIELKKEVNRLLEELGREKRYNW